MNIVAPSLRGDIVFAANEPSKAMPDVHPTKPWVVTAADDNASVVIWDYEHKVKIVEFSVNQLDEERKESLALQRMLEKDAAYRGPRTVEGAKVEKTGQIRYLRFFDRDTRLWKAILSKPVVHERSKDKKGLKSSGPPPPPVPVLTPEEIATPNVDKALCGGMFEHNYVIIVAEYRIIFMDYITYKTQEIKFAALENKPQMCVDCIGKGASVVFGGTDGVLRMWDCDKWEMTKQFSGGHTKSIVKVIGYESEGNEYLLSASVDGVVCQWNVKTGNLIIQSFGKIHHDAIQDMTYAPTGHLLSAAADKVVIMSEVSNGKEVCRTTLKHTAGSVSYFPHPHTIGSARPLLMHYKDRAQLLLMDCASGSILKLRKLADLNVLFNPSKKDNCKIYNLVAHPLLPNFVFCCTNRGSVVVRIGWHPAPSIAVAPPVTTNGIQELTAYYVTRQSTIQGVSLTPQPGYTQPKPISLTQKPAAGGKATVTPAKLANATGGVVDIAVSGGGKYISVLWTDTRKYQIFELATWKSVEEGQASGLCWATKGETYATFDLVTGAETRDSVDTLKRPKKDKKDIPAAPVLRAVVRVSAVGAAERERREVHNCGPAVALTGGLLLGIHTQSTNAAAVAEPSTGGASGAAQSVPGFAGTGGLPSPPGSPTQAAAMPLPAPAFVAPPSPVSQPMPPQSSSASATPIATPVTTLSTTVQHAHVLQLYDWATLRAHGPALPAPRLIVSVQDKDQNMYALAYDSWFIIVSVQPTIRVINRIPHVITSGTWHNRTLIYTTPTEIRVVFPHEQDVFPLVLCSFTFDPSTVILSEREQPKDLMYRPSGFVTVAGVRESPPALLLLDSTTFKCFSVPLNYSLIQFLMAVQSNKVEAALEWTKKIEKYYHKQLARFLVARGFIKEAARLEGLNQSTQFSIASRYNLTSTNESCFEGARSAFLQEAEAKEHTETEKKEKADREVEAEEGERKEGGGEGSFVDLLAADACLALGKMAMNGDMMSVAFKKGAEISSLSCTSLQDSVPLHQRQEIQYLKQLWQQKMKLIDP